MDNGSTDREYRLCGRTLQEISQTTGGIAGLPQD